MKKHIYKITSLVFALLIYNLTFNINNCVCQWVQMANGMGTNRNVYALAANGNTIFAGTNTYGVYVSTDNSTTWTQTSLNTVWVYSLAVNGNNIFVGTTFYGVYLSTNNGTSWTQTSLNNKTIYSLALNGNNVFAGTGSTTGLYLSTNNGTTWTQTSLNNRTVYSLAINGNNIFAGTDLGVYLSTDNGTSWIQSSLNNRYVNSLAVSGNNIFAGTTAQYGVYFSSDNGTNWTQTSLNNRYVNALAVSGNNIFAGTTSYSVYVSTDNGTTWIQRGEGLSSVIVYSLCILNNYIFAGTSGSSVYRSMLSEIITGITPISNQIPKDFSLSQNYPNPFNPSTIIKFQIPSVGSRLALNTTLKVYDILGKEVATLVNEKLQAGTYETQFSINQYTNNQIPSGVYFYTLTSDSFNETKKLLLLK